jgi:GntR family transcriptional regulator/MocR family aminotransferase
VIVTNGAQQAFDLIGRVLIRPGDIVAFEEPGYPMARDIFRALGARLMGVPVDEEGLTVERLPKGAKLVYVTPSHQFPLGVPMSLPRRVALLDWAAARGAAIIEDDYDSEFRFEGRPLESLQNLDRHGIVFYVGTFSKVLFPDLRLGFAIAPRPVRSALIAAKRVSDWYTALLEQATLAKFIQDGDLARHVRKMHTIYNRRRKCLLEGLRKKLSRWLHPIPSVAGLHTSAYLPPAMSADSLVKAAAKADVGVYSLDLYRTEKSPRPGIAFGYGAIEATEITQGLARLYRVLQQNV